MLRVALVGCGNIFRFHLEAYRAFGEKCEIVALADIVPEKCEAAVTKFGLAGVKTFASHTAMLEAMAGEIDLVSVCTPPFCHAEISIDSLKAGCNVLCEKPMAASLQECDAVLAAERESGKVFAQVAQNRFRDSAQTLKAALDSGLIGKVVHAQVDSHWWRGHCYYDLWWRGRWDKEGGGCTLNHAVHHIDLLLWLLGAPERVTAVLTNASHDNAEVEDLSVAILEYPNGALAQITSSTVHHGEEQQVVIQGEKARIAMPRRTFASVTQPNGFPVRNEELEREIDAIDVHVEHEGHVGEIGDVLDALIEGRRPAITGVDGRKTIELITAIYKAGSTRLPVKLPVEKDDAFYTVEGILAHTPKFFKKAASLDNLGGGNITTGSDHNYKY